MYEDFRLGDWVVRPRLNRVERPAGDGTGDGSDSLRHLEPRAMELLLYLAARPRQVVPRDEILADVWGGRYIAAQALNHTVWELRRALGDQARAPRYIETVTKRGYRLLAAVGPVVPPARSPRSPPPPTALTVGVAPWRDFSSGPSTGADRETFCAAMTELLTTLLAQVDALEVVLLGDRSESGEAAGEELQAASARLDAVIEGSALLSADRVRMTARLVAAGGKHLWAGAYDRDLTDVLRLQSEVVRKIVGEIEQRLRTDPEKEEGPG